MKLVLIFTLFFFGFTLSATNEQVTCSSGYVDGNTGHFYKVLTVRNTTWDAAKIACEAQGAELASIRSDMEWKFVKELIKQSGVDNHIFLGGTDAQQEGTWLWTDGSPVTFSDWSSGKPTNGTNWNCMVVYYDENFRWVDGTCSNSNFAVCKKPGVPVTTSPAPTCPPVITCPTTTCPPVPTCPPVTTCPTTKPFPTKKPIPLECIAGDGTNGYAILDASSRWSGKRYNKGYRCDVTSAPRWSRKSSDWKGDSKWYRFGPTGKAKLATKATSKGKCYTNVGAFSPDSLPGTWNSKDITLCYDGNNRCGINKRGKVTNCGSFYVYRLPDVPGCSRRYCATL